MLELTGDLVDLLRAITDVESVSGNEKALADLVEDALRALPHLEVIRDGDALVARTNLGRAERVVIAGHLDTVPVAGNLPSSRQVVDSEDRVYGRGTCDMKGGVAVQLAVAAAVAEPVRDITWIFYDHEEVDAERNGLNRLSRTRPELLAADDLAPAGQVACHRHRVEVSGDHDPLGAPQARTGDERVPVADDLQVRQRAQGCLDEVSERLLVTTHGLDVGDGAQQVDEVAGEFEHPPKLSGRGRAGGRESRCPGSGSPRLVVASPQGRATRPPASGLHGMLSTPWRSRSGNISRSSCA